MCRDTNGKYKFSFMEMITSGRDGSTSATGFIGVILSLVCITVAIAIFIFYFVHPAEAENILSLLDKVIIMLGIGSALLGTRKISGVIGSKNSVDNITQAVEKALDEREEKEERDDRPRRKYYGGLYKNGENETESSAQPYDSPKIYR